MADREGVADGDEDGTTVDSGARVGYDLGLISRSTIWGSEAAAGARAVDMLGE